MAKNLRSNVYEGGLTVDPTAGAGVAAAIGTILPRRGTTELWQKFGAGDTQWQKLLVGPAMAILEWGNDGINTAADTRFLGAPGGSATTAPTTDVEQVPMPRAGTLRNFYVRHNSGPGNANTVVYTVMVNGAATGMTVTLAANAVAQASDLVNTAAVAAGDRVSVRAVKAIAIGSGALDVQASIELVP